MVASYKVTDAPSPFEGPCPSSFSCYSRRRAANLCQGQRRLAKSFLSWRSSVRSQSCAAFTPDQDLFEIAAADDVLLLTDRAYPSMDSEALDQLKLEAFLDALDVQLRRRVRDADPENLNAAVSRALVLDAYDEADRRSGLSHTQAPRFTRHGQPALAAASVDPPRESPSVSDTVLQNLLSTQQQILQSLERLSVQQQCAPRKPSASVPPRTIVCFSCGEEGHMRSSCPRFPSCDRRQDSSRPPRQSGGHSNASSRF